MAVRKLLIILLILASLLPAYLFNRYAQKILQPRRSFANLLLYFLVIFVFITGYTFGVVWLITTIFPAQGHQ